MAEGFHFDVEGWGSIEDPTPEDPTPESLALSCLQQRYIALTVVEEEHCREICVIF